MKMLNRSSSLTSLGDVHGLGSLGLLGTGLITRPYRGITLLGLEAEIERLDGHAGTNFPYYTMWNILWPCQANRVTGAIVEDK